MSSQNTHAHTNPPIPQPNLQNPIEHSSSLSSTGTSHAPLEMGSSYTASRAEAGGLRDDRSTGQKIRDTVTGSGHSTSSSSTGGASAMGTGSGSGSGSTGTAARTASGNSNPVSGILAGIHGAGEKLRGEFNTAVDGAFNEPDGVAKNRAVANAGESEIETGHFAAATKNREGVVPGADGERRRY